MQFRFPDLLNTAGWAGTEPLSPHDSTLLSVTTPRTQLQIGALCIVEGEPLRNPHGQLRLDDLNEHVEARLNLIPRFRQRIQRVPLDLSRPVWVDDTDFDLERHLRVHTLASPGDAGAIRTFLADLLAEPLDDRHPLWEIWIIDGLDDGNIALVLRVHHVVADGLSLLRAASALLDVQPEPPPSPSVPVWQPDRSPGRLELVTRGLLTRRRRQVEIGMSVARNIIDPRRIWSTGRSAVDTVLSRPHAAPRLPITGRVGSRRDFVWTSLPMESLGDLAESLGVTVNDIVLTIVTGGLRRLLGAAGAVPDAERPPRVLVPVGDAADPDGGNAFSFVVTDLPTHLEDPMQVLERIHSDMLLHKSSATSNTMLSSFSIIDVVPIRLLQRLAPGALAVQPFVNLAVTNLPGSPVPLYLIGSRLLELQPIITGVGNIACIIGVLSYCDRLGIGITVDPDVVDDPDGLLDALIDAADELLS